MKKLNFHSSGESDSSEALIKEFNFKKAAIENDSKLSETEKTKLINQLEFDLNEKIKKLKWSLF